MVDEVWQIGDVRITRVVEIEATGGMSRIIPDAKRELVREISWLQPHFCDDAGRMRGAIHSLIIDTPDRNIVVDTCIGNDKKRRVSAWDKLQTTFLNDIKESGYPRESIDTVMCTHLHVDHVGWNTMLVDGKWVPTFENAQYLYGEIEFEHWNTHDCGDHQQLMTDSILPVFDAGLVDLVQQDHQICPEVRLIPTPGHTPGHVSVQIDSKGESALITGDFLHHPCQFVHPEWSSAPDSNPLQAIATRRNMYKKLAGSPTLVIGTHFATPTAGHLIKDGDTYRLEV